MKQLSFVVLLLTVWGYFGIFNNKLCIYYEPGAEPVRIFPYSVSIFPQNDQDMLTEGIPYCNEMEYHKLLEDFLS